MSRDLSRAVLGLWLAIVMVAAGQGGAVAVEAGGAVAGEAGGAAGGSAAPRAPATAGASGDRTLVNSAQLKRRPFRGVVLVAVGERVVCTGFVVGPRKVVTAAHCLTRDAARGDFRLRGDLPGSIQLYRGFSEIAGGTSFAACAVSSAWAHPQFVRRKPRDTAYGSRAHDYAVLTTAADCDYPWNSVMRMWATTASDGKFPVGSKIRLGGYPADSRFADMTGLNLWRSQGEVKPSGDDPRLIDTTGFVAQGMSGGPIWATFGKDSPCGRAQCVVGILTECAVNARGQCKLGDSLRRAVRITPEVKESIRKR
jgi:V8-like Glu-specific endopeptidase